MKNKTYRFGLDNLPENYILRSEKIHSSLGIGAIDCTEDFATDILTPKLYKAFVDYLHSFLIGLSYEVFNI